MKSFKSYIKEASGFPTGPVGENPNNAGGSLDEMHVLVIDEDGLRTGTPGEVLEKHAFVSKASDAKRIDGSSNYVVDVMRNESKYAWVGLVTKFTENSTGSEKNAGQPKAGGAFKTFNAQFFVNSWDLKVFSRSATIPYYKGKSMTLTSNFDPTSSIFDYFAYIFLANELAQGRIDLIAPQANAFATFSVIFAEGQGDLMLLLLGFMLGVFVEWATGMGTSFGLGMYLDVPHTLPMLVGGVARDRWEEKKLKPRIEAIKEKEGTVIAEKQRALILLGTFMVAAGLLTGEAFFGTESSILSFIDSLWSASFGGSLSWHFVRLISFILLNVIIGGGIYLLFKRAGVIGGEVQDAELIEA